MKHLNILALAVSLLAACGGGPDMPAPVTLPGLVVPFPAGDHVESFQGYLTQSTLPLTGKKGIRMVYRVDLPEGTTLRPADGPGIPRITLFFQRAGDDLTAKGPYEAYRWYATFSAQPVLAGTHTIEARFDQNWTAVLTSSVLNNPLAYHDALADAERIGFVLGGGGGAGHGILANGPATLTVLSYEVY